MSPLPFKYDPPVHTGLDVLYLDDDLIVTNKPAGLLSVPGRDTDKQDCQIQRVQDRFPTARIVHRLDMATSGAMVMALNDQVHRLLSIRFEQRKIEKRYEAIVAGLLTNEQGQIELPLITDWPNRPKQMIDHQRGKPSVTCYRVLSHDREQNSTRLELLPLTGRTHQIRVHLKSIGHPILGDRLYADDETRCRSRRLLLHSTYLFFLHPVTGSEIEIHSPAPF